MMKMAIPNPPLNEEEVNRLDSLIDKVQKDKKDLSPEEVKEMRGYVAKEYPDKANTEDIGVLLLCAAAVVGYCILLAYLASKN